MEGELYPMPALSGNLSAGNVIFYNNAVSLSDIEKTMLKELILGPGDNVSVFIEKPQSITCNNNATETEYGKPYSVSFEGEPLDTISISAFMGGVNIGETIDKYEYNKATIIVPSVTGSLQIEATRTRYIVRINATYTQSSEVHTNTNLESLRNDLVVKGGLGEIVELTDYTLSGTLEVGTSTITVNFYGVTDTFTVEVT